MPLKDDIIYLGLLVFSIFLGKFLRAYPKENRKWMSTSVGLVILFIVSGMHGLHCIISFAMELLLIAVCPSAHLPGVSFAVQFSYLLFFRVGAEYLPHLLSPHPPHTNAIQMILTLKLIGVAYELRDTQVWKRKADKTDEDEQMIKHRAVNANYADIFHYCFGHAGLLTGPYYKFRTFQDLYTMDYIDKVDCDKATFKRLQRIPFYIALFLISGYLFPLDWAKESEFYQNSSFLYRVIYMTPVFFNFRMRLYSGFALSECSCICAGLGAYPTRSKPTPGNGPTDLAALDQPTSQNDEIDFETIHNIDEYGAEFKGTMREALKTWNMTVQYWLAMIVYKRFPIRSLRTAAVMIVSSIWHGVYSGYYLSLGSVPIILIVEDFWSKSVRRKLSEKGQMIYDWINWFLRMQAFSYLGMAFQLLRIDYTLTFWHSVYYLGHTLLIPLYLMGFVVKNMI